MDRCKNFFALGMCYWLYNRSMEPTLRWLEDKFKTKPQLVQANKLPCKPATATAKPLKPFRSATKFRPRNLRPASIAISAATPRWLSDLSPLRRQAGLTLFLGSYPITPASDILHELSMYKDFGVITFQAEDEIAAITSAIGASYAGALGITTTSGPGMALKTEALGLAVHGRIAAGDLRHSARRAFHRLPTKTEQADLLQALFGRNSEAPIPVLAPCTPGDCFWIALEASRIAIKYMVPVIILSDGYLANGAEPWKVPDVDDLPAIPCTSRPIRRVSSPIIATPKLSRAPGPSPARRDSSIASAASKSRTSPAT